MESLICEAPFSRYVHAVAVTVVGGLNDGNSECVFGEGQPGL